MTIQIKSPYLMQPFSWLRGNLHTHTSNSSDSSRPPQEVIDDYASRGYDFLSLTDHDTLTDIHSLDARGMILLPGNEITSCGSHLLHLGASSRLGPQSNRQHVIDTIVQSGGLPILCHPNWGNHRDHYSRDYLHELTNYLGLELYNGIMRSDPGSPLATDRWDELLTSGRKIWGFANDDAHKESDVEVAWNVVQVKEKTVEGVLESLQHGRFYASTGVEIEHIGVVGKSITVRAKNAAKVLAIADGSRVIAETKGRALTIHVPETSTWTFIRFECWGEGEAMAWTQPFYLGEF